MVRTEGATAGGAAPPISERMDAPFSSREGRSLWVAYRDTWRLVALRPLWFFERATIDRAGTAVVFGALSASLGLFVSSFYSAVNWRHWTDLSRDLPAGPGTAGLVERYLPLLTSGFSWAEAFTAPVKVIFGLVMGAMWIHLNLLLLGARTRTFDATLTVVGYAFGIGILLALPVCGFPVVAVWLAVVLVLGIAGAQRCGIPRAAVAVLTPGVVVLLFGFRTWMQAMFALVKTFSGQGP